MNTQVIEFLKATPNSNKAAITETTGLKGLPLFNILKKMLTDGQIISQGEGQEMTYTLAENYVEKTEAVEQPLVHEEPQQAIVVTDNEEGMQHTPQREVDETKNTIPTSRDNSKLKWNGTEYGKGPLVRALLAHYVSENSPTLKKLKEVFPDELLKRFGVFQTVEKAREISGAKYDRYFFKPEHTITLKSKEAVVVSSQWTHENIQPLIKVFKGLGYKIK